MIDHADHAENSPSSAAAWTVCEDYINANRGLPDITSWEAAEGTAAHWIRNECLINGEDAVNYIGHRQTVAGFQFEWTADDAMLLQPGIDRLRAMEGKLFGEHWVDLTEWLGHDSQGRRQGGTLDVGMKLADGRYLIDDEKWGRGVPVLAKNSSQLRLYALGFGRELGVMDRNIKFVLQIDQPRHMGGGGGITLTWGELLDFGEWIKERAEATRAPNPPRDASLVGCMWCRRKTAPGGCATFDQYFLDQLMVDLDDLDGGTVTLPTVMTPERRATLLLHRKMIDTHLDHLYTQTLSEAIGGQPVGAIKPVLDSRVADSWGDVKAAKALITDMMGVDGFTKMVKSPKQVELALDDFQKMLVEPLIKRGAKRIVLVSEDDPRPAVVTGSDLEDLDDIATGETE